MTLADLATGRDNNLNLLRMVAASMVLFSHSYALTGHMLEEPLVVASRQRTDAATIGVVVFFAISGFLIAQSLARRRSLYAYAVARALRLVPGLVLAKVLCVFVVGWDATSLASLAFWQHEDTWRFLLGTPFFGIRDYLPGVFTGNPYPRAVNGSLWTIPVEAWCYAGAAVLAASTIMRRRLVFTIMGIIALVVYSLFPINVQSWLPSGGVGTIPGLVFSFLLGAWLLACGRLVPVSLWLAAAVVALLIVTRMPVLVFYAGIGYVALVLAYHPRLRFRPYLRVGDYSYGTYLIAFPVQQFLVWRFGVAQPLSLFVLALLTTLPLAMISWHSVEKPALAMKTRAAAWRPHLAHVLRRMTRSW